MNRHERRAHEAQLRHVAATAPDNDCLLCTTRHIAMQCVAHDDELRMADGASILCEPDHTDPNVTLMVISFGILEIAAKVTNHQTLETAVLVFGEPVLIFGDDDYQIISTGPWIDVLFGLRKMLDERFGPLPNVIEVHKGKCNELFTSNRR